MTTTINNEHKKLNVPNLRFPEFQGEWEKCKLGEIATICGGYAFNSKELSSKKGLYQVVKMGNLYQNNLDLSRTPSFINYIDSKSNKVLLHYGDIAITLTGTNNKRDFGYSYMFTTEQNLLLNQRCGLIRTEHNPYFVYNLVKTNSFLNQFFESSTGGTGNQANVSTKSMESFSVYIPKSKEQRKIADLLRLLDERIATQNKIIDKLQSLIKGIADKLFQTARTTKPLLEFAPNITSGTDKSGSGTIPLYGSTGIIGTVKNASQKGNIVLVARVGTIGTVQYVNEPCGVSDNALIVEAGEMTKYIYHFLKTYNFARITSGTTQPLITASSLKKAAIPTYDIESQTRIVLCLNGLEKKLDIAKQYLSEIAVMKQYLLRQMFV